MELRNSRRSPPPFLGFPSKIKDEGEQVEKICGESAEWCIDRFRYVGLDVKTGKGEVTDLKVAIEQQKAQDVERHSGLEEDCPPLSSRTRSLEEEKEERKGKGKRTLTKVRRSMKPRSPRRSPPTS